MWNPLFRRFLPKKFSPRSRNLRAARKRPSSAVNFSAKPRSRRTPLVRNLKPASSSASRHRCFLSLAASGIRICRATPFPPYSLGQSFEFAARGVCSCRFKLFRGAGRVISSRCLQARSRAIPRESSRGIRSFTERTRRAYLPQHESRRYSGPAHRAARRRRTQETFPWRRSPGHPGNQSRRLVFFVRLCAGSRHQRLRQHRGSRFCARHFSSRGTRRSGARRRRCQAGQAAEIRASGVSATRPQPAHFRQRAASTPSWMPKAMSAP